MTFFLCRVRAGVTRLTYIVIGGVAINGVFGEGLGEPCGCGCGCVVVSSSSGSLKVLGVLPPAAREWVRERIPEAGGRIGLGLKDMVAVMGSDWCVIRLSLHRLHCFGLVIHGSME